MAKKRVCFPSIKFCAYPRLDPSVLQAGYDSKTGKRIIKNVLGKTQAEVKEKLAQAQQETAGLDV